MNRNTLLLIAAGVGAYLIWKHLQKKSAVNGIGQTVDWTRLPMPGASMGSGISWRDESIESPERTQLMRSGRLADFNSVEEIGAAEFGSGLGLTVSGRGVMADQALFRVPPGSGDIDPRQQMMPDAIRQMQPGMTYGGRNPQGGTGMSAGMSMGRIGPMLPSLATGTYDSKRGQSLTDDEARAQARTAGGFGSTGRPGSGGERRSGAMLPRLDTGTWAPQAEAQVQPRGQMRPQMPMTPSNMPAGFSPEQGQQMPSFGSDSWGGDAGTSTDVIPNVL